jgi:hypothetical protein
MNQPESRAASIVKLGDLLSVGRGLQPVQQVIWIGEAGENGEIILLHVEPVVPEGNA